MKGKLLHGSKGVTNDYPRDAHKRPIGYAQRNIEIFGIDECSVHADDDDLPNEFSGNPG